MSLSGWTCPYCNRIATIIPINVSESKHIFNNPLAEGTLMLKTIVVRCPNFECQEYTITAALHTAMSTDSRYSRGTNSFAPYGDPILSWNMKPQSHAKRFPRYIPDPIIADYEEACLIQNLSPKASATLARRCLQGMIRDFWGVKKGTLFAEISAIQEKVDPQIWKAIDGVRSVGNIGAHMEKDINLIIDVEPNEASALIRLIEILIKDWYIARRERENNLTSVIDIAKQKAKEQGNKQ
ncbi:MAG: DUF4145 domain-containing protein [Candidatus Poribacteria bacterium]|nr:DUF4145 domain-containing protein [Candidatus Poribacteria bacterium]